MKSNIFFKVIIVSVICLLSFNVFAQNITKKEALNFADTKGKELIQTFNIPDIKTKYQKLDNLFLTYIDIPYISKFVMGKYYKLMTPQQLETYNKLFLRYALAYYKTLPLYFAQDLKYEILRAEPNGNFINVIANINFQIDTNKAPQNITISFRLHKVDNIIKVVDVKLAESSLLLSYRSKFYQKILEEEEEIDWFLEDLADLALSYEQSLSSKEASEEKNLEIVIKNI